MIEDLDPRTARQPEPGPELGPVVAAKPKGARRTSGIRLGIVLAACFALAAPVVATLAAPAVPSSGTLLAPGASSVRSASDETLDVESQGQDNGNGNGHKADKGKGDKLRGGHGPGKGLVTIASISGSNLSLQTDDGWTRTITVTSATVIAKGGQTVTAAELKVGDEIRFSQTRNADGSFTIVAIRVPTPRTGGEVTAVTGGSITVKQKGGMTRVITVTGSTVYTLDSAAGPNEGATTGSKADVKVGTEIEAEGTVDGDTFTATSVQVDLPHGNGHGKDHNRASDGKDKNGENNDLDGVDAPAAPASAAPG